MTHALPRGPVSLVWPCLAGAALVLAVAMNAWVDVWLLPPIPGPDRLLQPGPPAPRSEAPPLLLWRLHALLGIVPRLRPEDLPPTAGHSASFDCIRRRGPRTYELSCWKEGYWSLNPRLTPAPTPEGGTRGLKLSGLRADSVYRDLGLRDGDILRGVNGLALQDNAQALEVYSSLRAATRFKLELERDGQVLFFEYRLRP